MFAGQSIAHTTSPARVTSNRRVGPAFRPAVTSTLPFASRLASPQIGVLHVCLYQVSVVKLPGNCQVSVARLLASSIMYSTTCVWELPFIWPPVWPVQPWLS